jgi:hypothetical protein
MYVWLLSLIRGLISSNRNNMHDPLNNNKTEQNSKQRKLGPGEEQAILENREHAGFKARFEKENKSLNPLPAALIVCHFFAGFFFFSFFEAALRKFLGDEESRVNRKGVGESKREPL